MGLIRRHLLPVLTAWVLFGLVHSSASETSVHLQAEPKPGAYSRIQVVTELSGELRANPDGKQVQKIPIKGISEITYDEKTVAAWNTATPRIDVRHYQNAEARFAVGDGQIVLELSPERRLIGVESGDSHSVTYSPQGPLTRDELELLDVHGNSSVVDRLLPDKQVAINETWTVSDSTTALLLRLDVVTENKLECRLKKVEDETALMEMSGSVSGSVGGTASDLDVNAKVNFDLKQRRITWLAMSIREHRAVGHAEPGFEVTARVRVAITALTSCAELSDEIVSSLPLSANAGATLLTCTSADKAFQFTYPRAWRVMVDRYDVTVLRYVDRGELIAQCNLSRLPDAAPEKMLSMESFQADIQKSLAKNFGQFVEAKQFETARGLRALRVVVAGLASELPIQWIYYHLTDDQGHQASLVFTMDSKVAERFGGEDQTLVGALDILPLPNQSTAAAKTAETKTGAAAKR